MSGIDVRLRRLMYQRTNLFDGAQLLADAGVCAESQVELVLDIDALIAAKPIFKAVTKQDGANEHEAERAVGVQCPASFTGKAVGLEARPKSLDFHLMGDTAGTFLKISLDFSDFVDDTGRIQTFPFFTPLRCLFNGSPGRFTVTFIEIVEC